LSLLPPTSYVQLAVLTCYLPSSLKARSLAWSPEFAGFLQRTHENGDQSQCGISITFSLYTAHEHKFKEQFNTIYVIQHELMNKRSACPDSRAAASSGGRVIKMLAGLPDSACCMPLSAEQAPVHQEAVNYFWAKTDSASRNAVQISHLVRKKGGPQGV